MVVKDDEGITIHIVDLPPPPAPERRLTAISAGPTRQRFIPVPMAAPAEPVPERPSVVSPDVWTADTPVMLEEFIMGKSTRSTPSRSAGKPFGIR